MYYEYKILMPLDLQMFAKEGAGGEKTEDATAKKLEDVRKEGNVAKSREIPTAATLLALWICVKFAMGFIGKRLINGFASYYEMIPLYARQGIDYSGFSTLLTNGILNVSMVILPFLIAGFLVAFFSNTLQFQFKVTSKPLEPKFSKINPINGFKRIFSLNSLMELLKSIVKIVVIGYIAYTVLKEHIDDIYLLYDISLMQGISLLYDIVLELLLKIIFLFFLIAAVDFMFQKWKFKNDNKMTKQEVKDEYKNQEGDPKVKGQQRQRMQQASQRRMMAAIPEADVVITNPTHFAVALSYKAGQGEAPIVVAKGADFLASKIKDIAKENHVDIVENKPLARMLYYNVDLGSEIPPELYQAVAEVLAYVYQLHNRVS
ncbi:MAG: flagellar biosynthesis protein FlhB [Eubacteriales bacterium]|nr:flagellar biosynthesis protein FlhB [Eubacteriales bacterium]